MTCAYAVRGALQKFSGVEKVDVSLNKGLATVTLKPGNTVRLPDVWEAVRKNGFTPKETKVVVRGEVLGGAKTELKVTGTNEVYGLLPDPKAPNAMDEVRRHAGKTVTVEGTLQPPKGRKNGRAAHCHWNKELEERVVMSQPVATTGSRSTVLGYLSLFTSFGTLLCCALPSLLVLLGLGATVASVLSSVPWLVTLSRHKDWVFAVSGALIAANFGYVYLIAPKLQAKGAACSPDDPGRL